MEIRIKRCQGIVISGDTVFFCNFEFGLTVQILCNQPEIDRKILHSGIFERMPQRCCINIGCSALPDMIL